MVDVTQTAWHSQGNMGSVLRFRRPPPRRLRRVDAESPDANVRVGQLLESVVRLQFLDPIFVGRRPAGHLEMEMIEKLWPSAAAEPDHHVLEAQERPRLLIVDDQPVNLQALYQVFSPDHQVFFASSGEQAEKICRQKKPDLVLLDILMPGIDGYETCIRLKADPETRDIPVIFVTGESDEAAETRGLEVGAVDFITKPINPCVVRARVRTHITLKQRSDQLRRIAMVDGLTGIYNRRCFDDVFARESARAARSGHALSLLMIDVDHFKRFNDRYGHGAGDVCLQRVAVAIASTLTRPGDLVSRYGGEEFACVLAETEHSGAVAVAQLIEQRVRRLAIPHDDSNTANVVTISIGVATFDPQRASSATELLAEADSQLYRAKHAGRGQVVGSQTASEHAAS